MKSDRFCSKLTPILLLLGLGISLPTHAWEKRTWLILQGSTGYTVGFLDRNGQFQGLPNSLNSFRFPTSLAVDREGSVYIADAGAAVVPSNGSLTKIFADGTLAWNQVIAGDPRTVAIDQSGDVWVGTGFVGKSVEKRRASDGSEIWRYDDNTLGSAYSLAIDSRGRGWIADYINDQVVVLDSNKQPVYKIVLDDASKNGAWNVVVDRMGTCWVAGFDRGTIYRINADGVLLDTNPIRVGSRGQIELSIDRHENIWAIYTPGNSAHVFNPSGEEMSAPALVVGREPVNMASDGSGKALISNWGEDYLSLVDTDSLETIRSIPILKRANLRGDPTGFHYAHLIVPYEDFDRDGYSNTEEISLGSDPLDRDSTPENWKAGTVGSGTGTVKDVLFVNDSPGQERRTVEILSHVPFNVFMASPAEDSAEGGPHRFSLFAWTEDPRPVTLPHGIGTLGFPLNRPATKTIVNQFQSPMGRGLGVGRIPLQTPPPVIVRQIPGGRIPPRTTFTLQGLIHDPNSGGDRPLSTTNAVTVRVE